MLKLRGHTHDMMVEHKKEISKTKIGNHAKLDGGGTFGYDNVYSLVIVGLVGMAGEDCITST